MYSSRGSMGAALFGQADADNFLVVSHETTLVGIRRVVPDNRPAERLVRRLQHVHATDFLIFLGRQTGNDQIAGLAEQKVAVAILRQKRRAMRFAAFAAGRRLERLPQALAS